MVLNIGTGPQHPKQKGALHRHPKLTFLKKDPISQAVVDKLFVDKRFDGMRKRVGRNHLPHQGVLERVSDATTQNVTDANNIRQLLPDTELAKQILVSSILSPNDLVNVEMGYRVDSDVLESEVTGPLLETLENHLKKVYNITTLLPQILEECLFEKGAYPLLILPESSIDDIINSPAPAMESLHGEMGADGKPKRSIGILGPADGRPKDTFSLESYRGPTQALANSACEVKPKKGKFNPGVTVTDNLAVLKFPKVVEKLRKQRVKDIVSSSGFGMEARKGRGSKRRRKPVDDQAIVDQVYDEKELQRTPFVQVKTARETETPTRGEPMVMKLPVESVIPVHVPSNPEDHIGYFVLLDQFGNPINKAEEADYYRDLHTKINGNSASQLLESANRAVLGYEMDSKKLNEYEATRLYADIVEGDLIARLRNGVYGEGVEIARPLDVYRVMLSRALAGMGTQVLYVPCELMTYFAFDYNQYGVGKSLLEDNKILANLRAMLLFSNTMASIKNSTGRTGLRIDLDPNDPDPGSTVEYLVHEYSKNRQRTYPLGASNPLDIIDFLQSANVDLQVAGNPAYPETRMEVEDMSSNKVQVDSQLEDDVKRKYFMSLGLSPETIDTASEVEFATSIVTSNLLLAKRVMLYQDIYCPLLEDFTTKYVENSQPLYEALIEKIDNNRSSLSHDNKQLDDDAILQLFLDNLEITLPRPDTAKLENQIEAFRQYTDALELAVDAYFGEDSFMLKEFDDVEETIRAVRSAVIAYYQREWLRNNNVLPELADMITQTEEGKSELDLNEIHGNHMELIGMSIAELIERMRKDRERRDKLLEEQEEEEDVGGDTDDDTVDDGEGDEEDELSGDEEAEEGEEIEGDEETGEGESGDTDDKTEEEEESEEETGDGDEETP